jgi:predicted nuclease of predicted toxin-antitoxin system
VGVRGANGFIVVSKDTDFNQLAFVHGSPPKVVWLRVGNASTAAIRSVLLDALDTIAEFADTAEDAVLILPATPKVSDNAGE